MITDYKNAFLRDVKKITDTTVLLNIKEAMLSVEKAQSLRDIPELRKLKGFKKNIFYRIKIGNYRIGVTIQNDIVAFFACMHRKDIYNFFP